jgi:PleD family two-component response regulator
VTASFGVCHASIVTAPEAILGAADAALYRAKTGGRNRVVVADGSRAQ